MGKTYQAVCDALIPSDFMGNVYHANTIGDAEADKAAQAERLQHLQSYPSHTVQIVNDDDGS